MSSSGTNSVEFSGGTLLLEGPVAATEGAVWDERVGRVRAPAALFGEIARAADRAGDVLVGDLRKAWDARPSSWDSLGLRDYQEEALAAWMAADRRGIIALPTGAGKTRVAVAAIVACGVPAVVLCPTRALLAAWAAELQAALGERIGVVGDGQRTVERITVMTFESSYRRLDDLGDRFGLLVVDEVHHFASGARSEALEFSAAPARLGLSATAPRSDTDGGRRLRELVGPVVFSLPITALTGKHLAELSIVRVPVELEPEERVAYERLAAPLAQLRRAFFRAWPRASYEEMIRTLGTRPEGRAALRDYAAAVQLACFPKAKRALIALLLHRHRGDRTIVFTGRVEDAYDIAERELLPVISAEVSSRERDRILAKFRDGRLRAVASARVLNEGVDVPDARVAIVASGTLGEREHVQRIGRVLRPAPGKRALVYELVTQATVDERMARSRAAGARSASAASPSPISPEEEDPNAPTA
jgi:superfamily II DNA or RNA helicase